ncbi:glutaredoxin domain-containing protein [Clostridium sp. ZS2-4]|uniref:glutaredoxin domain-containing protein n=1 Tax=Clostridium sp. ZS2-4 TaxID=2987703 RepID=UPI00227BF903|nr:glutaredoxin domain-containing protein [Clostridium sp. ZS2-4]MCY6353737.1 glutathione S-transferase N-terminal domain-containing protein [Clostridium sp. ZS2-4]
MIKVYSTPTCPWSQKVKDYLKSKNARFVYVNVASDREERENMIELSGQQSVPVIDINGEVVIGFDKAAINNALDKTMSLTR